MVDNVQGLSGIAVTTAVAAAGGAEAETLESIRFNAPLTFTTQNSVQYLCSSGSVVCSTLRSARTFLCSSLLGGL